MKRNIYSEIIFFLPGEWKDFYHRKPLVMEISRRKQISRIFIIGIPADFVYSPLKKQHRFLKAVKSLFKTTKYDQKIYIYTPIVVIHHLFGIKFSIIRKLNISIFNWSIRKLIKREKINENVLVWVYRPELIDFIKFNSNAHVIYDCYDEYLIDSSDNKIKNIAIWEKQLIKRADVIFTTSTNLLNKVKRDNSNSYFIPNAANTNLFQKAFENDLEAPPDLDKIPKPIIGYVGVFRDWIDFDLLEFIFKKHKDKSFVFIGNWHKNVKNIVIKFKKYPNVFFLGWKRYEDIPQYVKFFDIAIIPNKMNQFNRNVIPLKLYEYMAAGKKILITNTSNDLNKYYSDYIEIADTNEEFSEKIDLILNDISFDDHKIFEFGRKQSWSNRVDEMFKIISNQISKEIHPRNSILTG